MAVQGVKNRAREACAVVAVCGWALLLSACSASMVRKEASQQIQLGNYEQALKLLREGTKRYPDEATLRMGEVSAQQEIATRLLSLAADARAAGREEQAQAALDRLMKIDPSNARAKALQLDLARDKRQLATVLEARKLLEEKKFEQALPKIETALKDDPRNPELLSLQRRTELELRSKETQDGGTRLAETRPITLEFRDVNLKMLVDALSRSTGVDFILDKDIRTDLRATLFLRNSRLEDALEVLASSNQLSKKLLDPRTVLLYPNTPEKQKEYQDLVVKAFYLANAEAKQTAALLKGVLKIRDPFVDEKLNLIIVRETPETIRLAERLVALHDVGEPEVLLEVEVLEVKTSRLLDLGIKFPEGFSLSPLLPAGAELLTLRNISGINRDRIGVGIGGIDVTMRRDVGDFNMIANPRIRAKNREKAKILVGDKLPVITSTVSANAAQGGLVSESVTYLDVGLKLDVEPQVSLDDEVTIRINMEVSSLARQIQTKAGSLAYQLGTRTASTALKLRDGETQLLAGLISNEDRTDASRVPGLGDLPVLGRLFASQRDDAQRTEVVLSITPRIIKNVRRPDVNFTEFWSGSETNLRLRPLTLASREPAVKDAPAAGAASSPTPVPMAAPGAQGSGSSGGAPGVQAVVLQGALATPTIPNAQALPAAALAWNGPTKLKKGETVEVALRLNTAVALRGLQGALVFDPQALELIDVIEGAYFKQGGAQTSLSKTAEADKGKVSFGLIRNTADGAAGDDAVVTVKLRGKAAGALRVESANGIQLNQGVSMQLPAPHALQVE